MDNFNNFHKQVIELKKQFADKKEKSIISSNDYFRLAILESIDRIINKEQYVNII
jgi:hypothetical protein